MVLCDDIETSGMQLFSELSNSYYPTVFNQSKSSVYTFTLVWSDCCARVAYLPIAWAKGRKHCSNSQMVSGGMD